MLHRGVLASVRVRDAGGVILGATIDGVTLSGVLLWEGLPTPADVVAALRGQIGRPMRGLAELDLSRRISRK